MKRSRLLLAVCVICFLAFSNANAQNYHEKDIDAIKEIIAYNSTTLTSLNWNTETDTSNWNGVTWDNSTPKRVTELNLDNEYLKGHFDATAFDSIDYLYLYGNTEITSINLQGLQKLDYLSICKANIKELDLSGLSNLTEVYSGEGSLEKINLTGCTKLEGLYCNSNKLTQLDVSQCDSLEYLYCMNNKLSELDLSQCKNIYEIKVSKNPLTTLDLSGLTKLDEVKAAHCKLQSVDITGDTNLANLHLCDNIISQLDISSCTNLEGLYVKHNKFKTLDLSKNEKLSYVEAYNNQIDSINLGELASLSLYVYDNKIPFESIIAYDNQISALSYQDQNFTSVISAEDSIDFSMNDSINGIGTTFNLINSSGTTVETNNTGIFTINDAGEYTLNMVNDGVEYNVNVIVKSLDANSGDLAVLQAIIDNNFTEETSQNWSSEIDPYSWDGCEWDLESGRLIALNLTNSDNEKEVYTSLTGSIDITGLDSLELFYCQKNPGITALNVTGLTNLEELKCSGTSIKELDLSNLTSLYEMHAAKTAKLTSINLTGCTDLYQVYLQHSGLSSVDFSNLTSLYRINIYESDNLTNINLSGCVSLNNLNADGTALTNLDVSSCTSLSRIYVRQCNLQTLNTGDVTLSNTYVNNNKLPLSQIAPLQGSGNYSNQVPYEPMYIPTTDSINFSSEALISVGGMDINTNFTLYDSENSAVETNTTGIFKVIITGKYYVTMTNSGKSITTSTITIYDGAAIEVSMQNTDFGIAGINIGKTEILTIRNFGTAELSVSDITLPNGYTIPDGTSYTIAAGEKVDINVLFNPSEIDFYNGRIVVSSNTNVGDSSVYVEGTGVSRIIELNGTVIFGDIIVGNSENTSITIENSGIADLTVTDITLPDGFTADKTSFTIAPEASEEVVITFSPTAIADYSGDIIVVSDATSGVNSLAVSGSGIAEPGSSTNDELTNNINVYPNPAYNSINVAGFTNATSIKLYNMAGVLLSETQIDGDITNIDISDLTNGIYFIKANNSQMPVKFIKQ